MRSIKIAVAGLAALAGLAAMPALTQQPTPVSPALTTAPAAAAAAPIPGTPQLTRADVDAWLDGYMPYALQRGDVAGAVVVVVKDGQVLTQRGYGFADVATRKPVDPNATLFRPGSVSKLFTWTAVMQLVEQGKLDLDKDVNAYLDFKIPPRDGKPITLRNIMTHTAGFEESLRGLITSDPKAAVPLGELMKRWTPERIFAPGTTPAYSNYATALAGYIVQRASGLPFDDYVERNIFQRIGMTRSSFRQPLPASLQSLMSKGYARGSGDPKPYEFVSQAPAGSLAATGADMAKFMIAHLDNGGVLLKPETARMMHTTTLDMVPPLNRMALGFYEQQINGQTAIGHGGDTQWFHSYLWLFPAHKTGVYISVNSAGNQGASGAIRTALFEQFADRYFPATIAEGRVDAKIAAEHARMLVGNYVNTRRADSSFFRALGLVGQVKVGLDAQNGPLIGFIPGLGGAPRKWVETEPFVWREVGGHERMAAKVVNGKVVRLSFDDISPFMMLEPAPWYLSTAWLTPVLLLSIGALAITALSWPIGAIARRRYGAKLGFAGDDLSAYRLVRGFAALVVAVLIGWAAAIGAMMSDYDLLSGRLDWLVYLLQILSVVAFFGMLGIALWNAWRALKGKRGWFSRLWSVVLVLAAFFALWAALGFKLISFGVSY
ncbi:serine hydrolase domain-containing protein [Sphingomonas cavernae]|uniref:Class A beta-lactamase-related serine hydrolase n=1 Tax=Sphingomonas cavernae TaxID=2320861 RepID=A0A418W706_9SPHN|nr:serine hydrolase domain-containing protein [Sphingomonas cavernae]RJF85821.1 class A beta-lactamase-related serine hydrolase [Sphingomonas cavernae]